MRKVLKHLNQNSTDSCTNKRGQKDEGQDGILPTKKTSNGQCITNKANIPRWHLTLVKNVAADLRRDLNF